MNFHETEAIIPKNATGKGPLPGTIMVRRQKGANKLMSTCAACVILKGKGEIFSEKTR